MDSWFGTSTAPSRSLSCCGLKAVVAFAVASDAPSAEVMLEVETACLLGAIARVGALQRVVVGVIRTGGTVGQPCIEFVVPERTVDVEFDVDLLESRSSLSSTDHAAAFVVVAFCSNSAGLT